MCGLEGSGEFQGVWDLHFLSEDGGTFGYLDMWEGWGGF